jgi:beta-xylosidase
VLHSKDLVNWQVIGQVFDRLTMSPKYDEMSGYGEGTWAPALRYHAGEFYLFVCTPLEGLFMWHTTDPAGKWSDAVTVKAVSGWEDPCPFWDDDGQAYLVHSLVGAGPLIVHRMAADGTQLLDDGVTVYTGPVAEGPKLFKRHGYYYISHPEGGVESGWQTVQRGRNIYGPYERRIVLSGGPHQGALVELPNGEAWFLGFQSAGWLGRLCYLEPVEWGDDDWPVFGNNGQPVTEFRKPVLPPSQPGRPQTSDRFESPTLNPIWQWNQNPVPGAWTLGAREGFLRLYGLPAADLSLARDTLTQKLWDDAGTIDVELDLAGLSEGQRAGLAFLSGAVFHWIGAEKTADGCRAGSSSFACGNLWFRGEYHQGAATLLYSLDGKSWSDSGQRVTLQPGFGKGARFGLFCYGPGGGYVDVGRVSYRYRSSAE